MVTVASTFYKGRGIYKTTKRSSSVPVTISSRTYPLSQ